MHNEVIISILEDIFGEISKHDESTGQVSVDCPACALDKGLPGGDGKANLEINYLKNVYKCWACYQYNDMSGTLYNLISKYGSKEHIKTFKQVRRVPTKVNNKKVVEKFGLPEGFTLLTQKQTEFSKKVMLYLKKRGIGLDKIIEYNIGYTEVGDYRNRLIVPSYDVNGELNFFISRVINGYIFPKYKNVDINKTEIIFNEYKINWDATIYLVEGVFDAMAIPNSIPLLGKVLYDKLFFTILEKANADIVIVLDDDAKDDAVYIENILNVGRLYGKVKIIYCPEGFDVAKIYEYLGDDGIVKLLRNTVSIPDSQRKLLSNKKKKFV